MGLELSEAIALGRTLCKPVAGTEDDLKGGGCSLGMAARAVGSRVYSSHVLGIITFTISREDFPVLAEPLHAQPCRCVKLPIGSGLQFQMNPMDCVGVAVTHLFDIHVCHFHDWTLDQLIDWVRSVENEIKARKAVPAPNMELQKHYEGDLIETTQVFVAS